MRAKSSKQRCPALCIVWLELLCSCMVGGWSGHLTASGSRYDFPGVNHEERQTCQLWFPWSHKGNPCSRDSLWLSLLQGFSDFFTCFLSSMSEKSFIPYKASAAVQALRICPVRPRVLSSWGITLLREAESCQWELKAWNSAVQLCAAGLPLNINPWGKNALELYCCMG